MISSENGIENRIENGIESGNVALRGEIKKKWGRTGSPSSAYPAQTQTKYERLHINFHAFAAKNTMQGAFTFKADREPLISNLFKEFRQ
jgi:hypothetical protein